MMKSIYQVQAEYLIKRRLNKTWTEQAREASTEARRKMREVTPARPAQRRLQQSEAFHYYAKIKEGSFGNSAVAKMLNAKVGMAEGVAKAWRERAGKMKAGEKDAKGRTREELLLNAGKMYEQAQALASQRDSALGHSAQSKKMMKQEYTEQDILDMIDSGEFDDVMKQELAQETGLEIE